MLSVRGSIRSPVLVSSYGTSRHRTLAAIALAAPRCGSRRVGRRQLRAPAGRSPHVAGDAEVEVAVRAQRGVVVVHLDDGRRRSRSAGRAAASTCSARNPSRRSGPHRGSGPRRAERRTRRRRRATTGCCRTAHAPRPTWPAALRSDRPGPPAPPGSLRRGRLGRRRTPVARTRSRRSTSRRTCAVIGGLARGARPEHVPPPPDGTSSLWTWSGMFTSTERRSCTARAAAAQVSATAVSAEVIRTEIAPTARARASWSTKKLDRDSLASAASRSRGVRLLAASASPVSAFVSPQPWCSVTAARRPLHRA